MRRLSWTTLAFATASLVTLGLAARADGPAVGDGVGTIRTVADLVYYDGKGADERKHQLDLYLPDGVKNYPVVLFIHGGAWSSGDRKLYGGLGRAFARNGVGAAIASYRLSPKVTHPAHVQDVARAFSWVHDHIAEYGGRPDRVFIAGQSAGAHLVSLLATNDVYLREVGRSVRDVSGVIPISGAYVFRDESMKRVLGDAPDAAKDASPLRHVTGKEPPFLIIYADGDFPGCGLMSKAMAEALKLKGVPADVVEVKDRNHISIIVRPMRDPDDPTLRAALDFVAKRSKPAREPAGPTAAPGEKP
jgi:acetyl esterase/lipase